MHYVLKMVQLGVFVGLLLGLGACQNNRLTYLNAPIGVAYTPSQADQVARRASRYAYQGGQAINLSQYKFFTENSLATDWLKRSRQRVIAIGYPDECARYYATWAYSRPYSSAKKALDLCLSSVKIFAQHTGKTCGCTVAAINNTVFKTAEELPFRKKLPAIALVKDERGRREILGYVDMTGRTGRAQEFTLLSNDDKPMCYGRYDIGARETKGKAYLDCFDGQIKGDSVFQISGHLEGQAYGTALVKAGENELIMVFGLARAEFETRRAQLLAEVQ